MPLSEEHLVLLFIVAFMTTFIRTSDTDCILRHLVMIYASAERSRFVRTDYADYAISKGQCGI